MGAKVAELTLRRFRVHRHLGARCGITPFHFLETRITMDTASRTVAAASVPENSQSIVKSLDCIAIFSFDVLSASWAWIIACSICADSSAVNAVFDPDGAEDGEPGGGDAKQGTHNSPQASPIERMRRHITAP